ncbi:MAG: phosphotransferase enzyme family protein [Gammaproteobacteria bacterium]
MNADLLFKHWKLQDAVAEPFGTGLINETYLVTAADSQQFILQGLNPVFEPEVNIDIDRLTRHLAESGRVTQRLVATVDKKLWATEASRAWRLSSFVPGVCFNMLTSEAQAREAGALLGNFHSAVQNLQMDLHTERLGVHDTQRHLRALEQALNDCKSHRYFADIEPLAQSVLEVASSLPQLPSLPDRLVHGDPKISNLVFDESSGQGICMIDLDTISHMPLPLEMGDAFRSWCNPRGEDTQESRFRLDFFAAAIEGYADQARTFVLQDEWQSFVTAARIIMVELATRFTTDALKENYFGWNEKHFPDRSTHNQVRAAGQLELFRSLSSQAGAAESIVETAFNTD